MVEIPGSVEGTVYNTVREIFIKSEKWVTEKYHVSLKCIFSLSPESECGHSRNHDDMARDFKGLERSLLCSELQCQPSPTTNHCS